LAVNHQMRFHHVTCGFASVKCTRIAAGKAVSATSLAVNHQMRFHHVTCGFASVKCTRIAAGKAVSAT
ncbi:hypothetical protein CKJ90_33325, partial [Klebsiella pneumoniae]